jgi:predicted DNA-binding transcriptional regulator AlpA
MSEPIRLLAWADLRAKGITVSKPTIYRMLRDGVFPRPVYIARAPLWPEHEIDAYIRKLMATRP